jgi:N-acetylneuraminate synthase
MSGNHNQSLDKALELVEVASRSGAHAIKLQTYTADTITLNVDREEFKIKDKDSLWSGETLYQLYEKAHTPWDWHKPIMDRAKELGLLCFSSPFDESAVDFLEELQVPAYKIASFESNHLPLIRKVASTGKPMIISTGLSNIDDLKEAVATARGAGCKDLILLKCTSSYPASPENTNISTIPHMRDLFNVEVGLSDHTMGVGVAVASVAYGASIIEKHFTLKRSDGGVDSAFSLEPHELKSLVVETERAWQSLGEVKYGPTNPEKKSLMFRRSIYFSKDSKKGEVVNLENIKVIRPGHGLHPRHFEEIQGKVLTRDVFKGEPVDWKSISSN